MGTHYSHMTPAERMSIQALLQAKFTGPAIALKLGFSLEAFEANMRATITPSTLVDFAPLSAVPFRQRSTGWGTGSLGVTIGEQSAIRLVTGHSDDQALLGQRMGFEPARYWSAPARKVRKVRPGPFKRG